MPIRSPQRTKPTSILQEPSRIDMAEKAPQSPDGANGSNPIWGNDIPLTLEDAAAFTGMPLPSFKQKIYSREIDSVKVGRRRKVQPSAVRAYLQKHKRPAL